MTRAGERDGAETNQDLPAADRLLQRLFTFVSEIVVARVDARQRPVSRRGMDGAGVSRMYNRYGRCMACSLWQLRFSRLSMHSLALRDSSCDVLSALVTNVVIADIEARQRSLACGGVIIGISINNSNKPEVRANSNWDQSQRTHI